MGELRTFLKSNLPKYEDPVILISSNFIPGCSKCKSDVTVYYIKLTERSSIPKGMNLKAENHKFPIDIYIKYPAFKKKPKKFVIGTKKNNGNIQLVLRKIVE